MELIDVKAAKEYVETMFPGDPVLQWLGRTMLEKLPKVEVVRCKDCENYCNDKRHGTICRHPELDYDIECYDQWINTKPDDFCSFGKGESNGIHKTF